ncbi:sugar ABC transporter substrate-binding protein [Nocardioides sp. CBS4Y-1]|uniref:Sugar ABC transporter substrate-binding protein n=1 Tax=Nocardioides acrostichi TaxID=2784339 RepID=A0A930YEB8_9ACTN|nr:sugar ABC transporter substrate-binding protein [Nocardioides acrostichi]
MALSAAPLAACGGESTTSSASSDAAKICVDFPRSDTDFWNAFISYVPQYADEMDLDVSTSNSAGDVQKLVANVTACVNQGGKAVVIAPQDTAAVAPLLEQMAAKDIPVVSLDTAPDSGTAYMVVRADNKALGEQACEYLGEQMGGKGAVVELMGGQDSVNGRDRREGFGECMKSKYPDIRVIEEPSEWEADKAQSQLQTAIGANQDVRGVYMASSFALAGTIQVLKAAGKPTDPSDPDHVFVVSNDGIPQEYKDISEGTLDATVSQPADLYAKYGLYYAEAAIKGETFEPGETDHDSTIVEDDNGFLEDQLPSVLVTKDNVDDPDLWGNTL